MESKKETTKQKKKKIIAFLGKTGRIFLRWLYLIMLIAALGYTFFIWNKFVLNAEWSEARKSEYISKQTVFSFDKNTYEKAINILKARQDSFASEERFSGKDIFFPDGF